MSRTIRLCMIIPELSDGGAQRQFCRLVDEIRADEHSGFEVWTVRFRKSINDHWLVSASERDLVLDFGSNLDPRIPFRLRRLFRRHEIDYCMSWLTAADILVGLAQLGGRSRWILNERNSSHPPSMRQSLRKFVSRWAFGLVANSRGGLDWWGRSPARRGLLPNIVADSTPVRRSSEARPTRLLYLGRLEPQKGVGQLLSGVAEDDSLELDIVGAGSLEAELRSSVNRLGLHDRVQFLGYVNEVDDLFHRYLALVTLSRHEGSPNAVLEAVRSGLPVIASPISEHVAIFGSKYPYYIHWPGQLGAVAHQVRQESVEEWRTGSGAVATAHVANLSSTSVIQKLRDLLSSWEESLSSP